METHQWGSNPLTIHIDGPSKYVLIKRHEFPPARLNPFCAKDHPARDDGPPAYPGTRVTVHLKAGWRAPNKGEEELNSSEEGIVALTLRKFAVNVDVPITVHRGASQKSETAQYIIKSRRWDEEEPLFPDNFPEVLREYLYPVRIPFENFKETRDIRGGAWFWFLKGENGKASYRRGFCSISWSLFGPAIAVSDPILRIGALLKEKIDEKALAISEVDGIFRSPPEYFRKRLHEELNKEEIPEFDAGERGQLLDIAKGGYLLSSNWTSDAINDKIARALLEGNRPAVLRQLKSDELDCEHEFKCQFYLARYGILVPAGILELKMLDADSRKQDFGNLPVTARCDLWGASAVQPSANPLNIPFVKSSQVRVALFYAVAETLQSVILDSGVSKDWLKWIERQSFSFSGAVGDGLLYAWKKGRCLFMRSELSFLLATNGSTASVSV